MNTTTRSLLLHARRLLGLMFVLASLGLAQVAPAQTANSPVALANGTSVGPFAGGQGSMQYYTFTVPAGASRAVFSITGAGSGDADLYVRYGSQPTVASWDFRPYLSSSTETVTVANPQSGTWHVMVRGWTAYSGVTLRVSHTGGASAPTLATPTFSPAPGSYSGQVSVALSLPSAPASALIRFTVDGSAPTAASEVYNAPIIVTSTTTVRAAAFATGYTTSAVATGTWQISNPMQTLTNNVPVTGLSGAVGSIANWRFAVPSGAARVTFSITGGSGDADLYVKYGAQATTSVWDQRPYLGSSNETVTLDSPRAGDYYLMVRGYSAYSGVTLKASIQSAGGTGGGGKPDLVAWGPAMSPRITTETFAAGSCDVAEGTITAGTKRLLRFSTQSRNIGTADLVLGNPANNPSFEWGSCHGHYHFRSFAQYRLLNTTGAVVRTGHKVGFCLMDITRTDSAANPSARYTCSSQGIQAGWADVYSSGLSGQWIDITGVPAGQYVLEVVMDPMNVIDELDETNNTTRITVTIP